MHAAQLRAVLSADFVRFFLGSGGGLLVDLGGFAALTSLGVAPGIANMVSSFASISVVYALVTRYAFGARATARTYVAFVLWYSTSIIVFSSAIEFAAVALVVPALACKLCSVPVSFALNYCFSRFLFADRAEKPSYRSSGTRALDAAAPSARRPI